MTDKRAMIFSVLMLGLAVSVQASDLSTEVARAGFDVYETKDWNLGIERVYRGTSAQNEKLWEDMILKSVDGKSVQGQKPEVVQSWLSGAAKSEIKLVVIDHGSERDVNVIRDFKGTPEPCFIKGRIDLRKDYPGSLQFKGKIGGDTISFTKNGLGQAVAVYKNEFVTLQLRDGGGYVEFTGFIHNRYVRWNGSNHRVWGDQRCIPNTMD